VIGGSAPPASGQAVGKGLGDSGNHPLNRECLVLLLRRAAVEGRLGGKRWRCEGSKRLFRTRATTGPGVLNHWQELCGARSFAARPRSTRRCSAMTGSIALRARPRRRKRPGSPISARRNEAAHVPSQVRRVSNCRPGKLPQSRDPISFAGSSRKRIPAHSVAPRDGVGRDALLSTRGKKSVARFWRKLPGTAIRNAAHLGRQVRRLVRSRR